MDKQTAVEFLEEKAMNGFITPEDFEQAKAMEKEKIIDAHECGYTEGILHSCESGEEYYNETYKSE